MTKSKLSFQIKYLLYLIRKGKFKTLYNYLWVYPLWISYPIRTFLVDKLFRFFNIEPFPPFLEVEVTTFCNLRCKMCEHSYWKEPNRHMTLEQFKHIVDQFPRLKWAGLTGIGESLLNQDFIKMVKYLKETSNPVLEVIDNFFLLNKDFAKEFIKCGVDEMFVSMSGATAGTYEKIMVNSKFETVIQHLKDFDNAKKEQKSLTPILSFHYIVSKENIHEAEKFLDLVNSLGINFYEVYYTPLLHGFDEIKESFLEEFSEDLRQRLEKKAEELNIHIGFNLCSKSAKPRISSCSNWLMPFIFVTGHVIPCCVENEGNRRDAQKGYAFGNVFEQSFRDIWYGERYRKFRKILKENKVPAQCTHCSVYNTHERKNITS